ncbi:MAG: nucleotide pyrophosphatase, partial [Halobacteria archaeon]|nr:nucleotide pyrophosphatase [Halobacteria archaeon]
MSTTVVLGWDGLDYELCSEFGFCDSFAPHHREIRSIENPILGKPHTYEVWPSIITGVKPDKHGVHLLTEGGGARMSNPAMRAISNLVHSAVSKRTRVRLGLAL